MLNFGQMDKLGEECGIFGGYCKIGNVAPYIQSGLFRLQHRGQESAGISVGNKQQILYKNEGLVSDVFDEQSIKKLTGKFGIGHVRYSTQGGTGVINAQPHLIEYRGKHVSIAHNGNIKKASEIRIELEKSGESFKSTSDSEVLLKKIILDLDKELTPWTFDEVGQILDRHFAEGAFSIAIYLPNKILAYRDPCGYRPLMFCEAEEGYFIASEDVAFSELSIIKIEEIKAGWGVEITDKGYEIKQYSKFINEQKCVFEPIYFANPASNIFGVNVYESRIELGKLLAQKDMKMNVEADIVVPVMNSGFASAIGYAKESGIPFEMGLSKNDYLERSFIQPTQQARVEVVREKLSPIKSVVEGKKIVLVDDSIVRGTTSTEIIKMLRNAGAKEIHLRLASPMIQDTCIWGVDIPTKGELLANICKNEKEVAKYINADSVRYLPIEDLSSFFGEQDWCYKCFGGKCRGKHTKCEQHTEMPALV